MLNAEPQYQAITVPSGTQALEVLHRTKPDLILLDLMLPDMDGVEIYAQLQAQPSFKSTSILFVTAYPNDPRFRLLDLSHYVLGKPFGVEELLGRVATALQQGE